MSLQNPDGSSVPLDLGAFHILTTKPDVQAIIWVLNELQKLATTSTYIIFSYDEILNRIHTT